MIQDVYLGHCNVGGEVSLHQYRQGMQEPQRKFPFNQGLGKAFMKEVAFQLGFKGKARIRQYEVGARLGAQYEERQKQEGLGVFRGKEISSE